MGGGDITDSLSDRLGVPTETAPRPTSGRSASAPPDTIEEDPAVRAIQTSGGALVEEVRGSLDYYMAQPGAVRIGRVVLSGGGSRLAGLADRLAAATRLPVQAAHPLSSLRLGRTGLTRRAARRGRGRPRRPARPGPREGVVTTHPAQAPGRRGRRGLALRGVRRPGPAALPCLPRVNLLPPELLAAAARPRRQARARRCRGRLRRPRRPALPRCHRLRSPTPRPTWTRSAATGQQLQAEAGKYREVTAVRQQADAADGAARHRHGQGGPLLPPARRPEHHAPRGRLAPGPRRSASAAAAAGRRWRRRPPRRAPSAPSPSPASASTTTAWLPGWTRSPAPGPTPPRRSPSPRESLSGTRRIVTFQGTADAHGRRALPPLRPGRRLTWTPSSSGSRCRSSPASPSSPRAGSCSSLPQRADAEELRVGQGRCRSRPTPACAPSCRCWPRRPVSCPRSRQARRDRPADPARAPSCPTCCARWTRRAAANGVELRRGLAAAAPTPVAATDAGSTTGLPLSAVTLTLNARGRLLPAAAVPRRPGGHDPGHPGHRAAAGARRRTLWRRPPPARSRTAAT